MVFNVTDTLAKPTYDIASYGEDLSLNLGTETGTIQAITCSSANFEQSGTDNHMDSYDILVSDNTTAGLVHEGNDTAYDQTFEFLTDMSAILYKYDILCAVGVNVSSFSSGSVKLDSVRFTATENLQDGTVVRELFDNYVTCSLSALTGTGTNVFIAHSEGIPMVKIANSNVVKLRIRINETTSGTNTRQVGILPLFPFQKEAVMKQWTNSVFEWHLHPALDHAFNVFRDQSIQNLLDYSGVTIKGILRGIVSFFKPKSQEQQIQNRNTGVLIG